MGVLDDLTRIAKTIKGTTSDTQVCGLETSKDIGAYMPGQTTKSSLNVDLAGLEFPATASPRNQRNLAESKARLQSGRRVNSFGSGDIWPENQQALCSSIQQKLEAKKASDPQSFEAMECQEVGMQYDMTLNQRTGDVNIRITKGQLQCSKKTS